MARINDLARRRLSDGVIHRGTLAAGIHCYRGSLLYFLASGQLTDSGAAGLRFAGVAEREVDATAVATVCEYNRGQVEWLPNSGAVPVVAAGIGRLCYGVADDFVRIFDDTPANAGSQLAVGTVLAVNATEGVLVAVGWEAKPDQLRSQSATLDVQVVLGDAAGATGLSVVDSAGSEVLRVNSDGDLIPLATADLVINLGDAAGARAVSIHDSGDAEVAYIDSNGDTQVHDLAVTGTYTAIAGIAAPAGSDFTLTAAAGFDLVLVQGDAGGVNEVSFRDSGNVEHATIDSDGNAQFDGTLNVTGIATFTAAPVLNGGAGLAAGQALTGAGALTVGVAAGAFDLSLKLGDAAGAQKLSVKDSAGAEVASINSNGLIACAAAEGMIGGYVAAAVTEPPTDGELALLFPTLNATNGGFAFVTNTGGAAKSYLCVKAAGAGIWKTVEIA